MTPNKRDLKAYARFDGTGRVVPGSLVLRRSMPKNGNWKEMQTYECCNVNQTPVLLSVLNESYPIPFATIEVGPNDGIFFQTIVSYSGETAANRSELADIFNASFPNLGTFKIVDGDLYWTPSITVAEFYKNNGVTELYGYAFEA